MRNHKICMRFAQDLHEICMRIEEDMNKIHMRFVQDLHAICPGYVPYSFQILSLVTD